MAASVPSVSALNVQLGAHDKPALPYDGDRLCALCDLPKSKTPWAHSGQGNERRRCCSYIRFNYTGLKKKALAHEFIQHTARKRKYKEELAEYDAAQRGKQ